MITLERKTVLQMPKNSNQKYPKMKIKNLMK